MLSSPSDPSRLRKLRLGRWLLVVCGLTCAAFVLELACRVEVYLDNQRTLTVAFSKRRQEQGERIGLIDLIQMSTNPSIVYELKPNLDAVPFKDAAVSTNSSGFRGPEFALEPRPDLVTIVGIGDSIMFGYGVEQDECYLAVLESLLRAKYPQKGWRILNTAAPAYNTVMEVELLRTKALLCEPDLVLWNIVPNDLELPQFVGAVGDPFTLQRSYLWARVRDVLAPASAEDPTDPLLKEGRDRRLVHTGSQKFGERTPEEYQHLVGIGPFQHALDGLADLAREEHFEVVSFSTIENSVTDELIAASQAKGFVHIALLPQIQEYMSVHKLGQYIAEQPEAYLKSKLAIPGDGHPTALQHRMAAEKILSVLEQEGIVERLLAKH